MKMKRFLSALLCAALMLTLLPATAQAHTINTGGTYDMADLGVASGGTISIGAGLAVTLTNSAGTTYTNVQIVCGAGVSLTLNNVKIDNSAVSGACALSFTGAGNVLTLEDESTLISGENRHGVRVDDGTELNISGTGTLSATGGSFGAGIGGAGIGGGYGGGGIITINGGTVTATGGACGAGIGGGYGGSGGIITINGGTVTAIGGYAGAGIGGGAGGSGGTVEITGGSVKASGSFGIQSTPTNGTANGNKPLSLAETALPLTDTQVFDLTITGASYYGVNDLFTDAGGKLYLWLPAGATVSQARTADTIFNNVSGTLVADINIAAIPGVTAPVRGATPVTAITETAQYTGSVTWNPDHLAFAGGTVYTATITLTPKAGYTLTGVVKDFFTVAGADTVTNAAYSGVVTAVFPATEAEPSINPEAVTFDLDSPGDVSTTISWGSATTVTDVVYGSDHLESPLEYTVSGDTLSIKEAYLSGLNPTAGNALEFSIAFNAGDSARLTVNIVDSYVPSSDASLSDLKVAGVTVSGFVYSQHEYTVELPYGTQPGDAATVVTATPNDPRASVAITQATTLPGIAIVKVTAEDGITSLTYTINFTLAAPTDQSPPTWPAGSTLTASGTTRTTTTLSWTPAQDDVGVTAYTIFRDNSFVQTVTGTVYSCNVSGLSPSTTYTFKVQAGDAGGNWTDGPTVTVSTDSSGGGDSGGSDSSSTPATPTYKATVSGASIAETALPVRVNTNTGSATTELVTTLAKDIFAGTGTTLLTAPFIPGVSAYTLEIPAASLSGAQGEGALAFATGAGSLTIPAGMLAGIPGTEGSSAGITIARGDKSGLPAEVQTATGDRPAVQLTLTLDGTQTEWNNPDAPVTVSIPYTPAAAELANPESIVVWHIDSSGNVVSVPNGRYDPATGTVTFTTAYFNHYAVSYKQVSFKDVAKDAWYARAVSFIAARGITAGTGNGNFSPEAKLTRGQFIVMLMKAYGIAPDLNPKDNFADAGSTWYTGFLAAARQLGISAGVGDNLFAPEKEITRQEMFTLLHNALKVIGQLPRGDSGKTLSSFTDADDIAPWAKDAMKLLVETGTIGGSGGKLTPADTTTRAQMARVLHGLLGK